MTDDEPLVLELDSETMWALADDRQTLNLNLVVPAVAGLSEPLTINIEFDYESVRAMILRLRMLSAQMVR